MLNKHQEESYVSGEPKIKFSPCNFDPGSEEKIEIISQRYDNGLPLFHDLDYREV
jgi:hypothetical protein